MRKTAGECALLWLMLVAAVAPLAAGRAARALPGGWEPWPWHQNDTVPGSDGPWAHTLNELWNRSKDSVGFCLGSSQAKAQRLMVRSAWRPMPIGPAHTCTLYDVDRPPWMRAAIHTPCGASLHCRGSVSRGRCRCQQTQPMPCAATARVWNNTYAARWSWSTSTASTYSPMTSKRFPTPCNVLPVVLAISLPAPRASSMDVWRTAQRVSPLSSPCPAVRATGALQQ